MPKYSRAFAFLVGFAAAASVAGTHDSDYGDRHGSRPNYDAIQTIVVIYAENRSFDNLFGTYPGANGLRYASPASSTQVDRDGTTLPGLPAVWGGTECRGRRRRTGSAPNPDRGADGCLSRHLQPSVQSFVAV